MNFKDIPIIIQARDRLTCMLQQIEAFTSRGYNNIHILDVNSSYPPLLEYYKQTPYEVIRLGENFGHTAFISQGIVHRFNNDWYCYTDPDVIPDENCPDDFMEYFYNILQAYPQARKAGFGLRIDDIPDHYNLKNEMIGWENQFWQQKLPPFEAYMAPIDTTFGLCRPGSADVWAMSARTGFPYVAKHSTWYLDPKNLPEDERYYAEHARTGETNWSGVLLK